MVRVAGLMLVAGLLAMLPSPAVAQSRPGELRGAWLGEGYDRDWPEIMASLRRNGFNALFPNMCTAGAAYYPSDVLPRAEGWTPGRDELAEALRAARENGIELHVWRINWVLFHAPEEVRAKYEAEGRLMRTWKGQLPSDDPGLGYGADWLCPSHPANRELEKDAMLEIVRTHDVAGIHFDYMRYPSPDYCFCEHCRVQFEKDAGVDVQHWPDDVRGEGPHAQQYADWRRDIQTSLVAEISREAHRINPSIFVSLAAWPETGMARTMVLQDWPAWVANGSLDFICFMTYSKDPEQVSEWTRGQADLVGGAIPSYSGLAAYQLASPWRLVEQIEAARAAGADGFVAFAYHGRDFPKWLPRMRATVTATDPDPMPHWAPPARFELSGPAAAPPAADRRVLAGAPLDVRFSLGNQPESVGPDDRAAGEEEREAAVSGRVVVENPSGDILLALGPLDAGREAGQTLRFTVPEGPFRVAAYGSAVLPDGGKRDVVIRSPLLTGMSRKGLEDTPDVIHAELDRAMNEWFCASLTPEQIGDLECTLQVRLTGPGGGEWWFRLAGGKCESGTGPLAGADVIVTGSAGDVLPAARGEGTPEQLFESGRLTASGDDSLMNQLAQVLLTSWHAQGW
jgi:uncharacterized lipoprotein YddW (UPF0748 family)